MRAFSDIIWDLTDSTEHTASIWSDANNQNDLRIAVEDWWDKFAIWPPNVFALTSTVLLETGVYKYIISPPDDLTFPPESYKHGWNEKALRRAATCWIRRWHHKASSELPATDEPRSDHASDHKALFIRASESVIEWIQCDHNDKVRRASGRSLRKLFHALAEDDHEKREKVYDFVGALLYLHAVADECMVGIGIPELLSGNMWELERVNFAMQCNLRLMLPRHNVSETNMQVVPKMRTPQVGLTARSLSLFAAVEVSEFDVRWHAAPEICRSAEQNLNLLLLPWPDEVHREWIRRSEHEKSILNFNDDRWGFFQYAPTDTFDIERLRDVLFELDKRGVSIDGIILPELAISERDFGELEAFLEERRNGTGFVLAGVHKPHQNAAVFAVKSKDGWREWTQRKHHRWKLERRQLESYRLAATLSAHRGWWEDVQIRDREVHFVAANSWLTMCHLICEDLARLDPVADIVRAVGPNLIIALLLDGPQASHRWSARFASVLADDPGSSVLTLTSRGMMKLAHRHTDDPKREPSRAIASWTDSVTGARSLSINDDDDALLLTLGVEWKEEWSVDGRQDDRYASTIVYRASEGIKRRPCNPRTGARNSRERPSRIDSHWSKSACIFVAAAILSLPESATTLLRHAEAVSRKLGCESCFRFDDDTKREIAKIAKEPSDGNSRLDDVAKSLLKMESAS